MAWGDFPRYEKKAEKQARATKKLEQLKKKRDVQPIILQGSSLARTWWGKSWNRNLERYADYSNRIGRGRSYVRHGAVLDLQIDAGEIRALVQGSRSKPYEIVIRIGKLNKKTWQSMITSCSGMLESASELLAGKFPKELGEMFLQRDAGLFPSPKEISFECSCPDWASMCKHVAAALYGVGARLDETPTLFFRLRGIDTAELIGKTVSTKAENLLEKATQKSSRVIDDADLSALFGINVSTSGEPADRPVDEGGAKRTVKRKAQEKKVTAKKTISRKNTKPPVNDEKSIRAAKSVKRKAVVKGTKRKKRPRALPTKLLS